jgi:energy-coupling factor transporter ATP-binding protein EcfA2
MENNLEQLPLYTNYKIITEFFFQSLLKIKTGYEEGELLFNYLFYNRNPYIDSINLGIQQNNNITIVGDPGQGKSSLMHFMFIEFKKDMSIFPIILDYREIVPRSPVGLLMDFIPKMKKYFDSIKRPLNTLTDIPNETNVLHQFRQITEHLDLLPHNSLTKKLIIFLDDMDYAEENFYVILKEYFLNYAASDKVVFILSCRRPLLNTICQDDQLRQCYNIHPKKIELGEISLEALLHNRLKSVVRAKDDQSLISKVMGFRKQDIDDLLVKFLKKKYPQVNIEDKLPELPFKTSFYSNLYDITLGNLRDIETILPIVLEYELKNQVPSFNDNFLSAFFQNTSNYPYLLLNLVNHKSQNNKKRLHGNAILQNVLEYFYFNDVHNDHLYSTMSEYGITNKEVDAAISQLVASPFNLLEPGYLYTIETTRIIHKRYKINNKGKKYINEVLVHDEYYSVLKETKSNRSYCLEKKGIK